MADLHNITSPIAKVTAAAPSYTEGDVAGLSLDLAGALRTTTTAGETVVAVTGNQVTYTNKSGTITAGGAAQAAAALNAARRGFWIQNQSTGDLWINSLVTATGASPDLWLPAGAYYEFPETGVPTTAISIIGSTTGQAWAAREW